MCVRVCVSFTLWLMMTGKIVNCRERVVAKKCEDSRLQECTTSSELTHDAARLIASGQIKKRLELHISAVEVAVPNEKKKNETRGEMDVEHLREALL